MNLITYADAADILGVSVSTIKQALEPGREVLTKAGRRGNAGLLIEEQVRLFEGINPRTGKKKRLSLNALSSHEKQKWTELASMVDQREVYADSLDEVINEKVSSQIESLLKALNTTVTNWKENQKEVSTVSPFRVRQMALK